MARWTRTYRTTRHDETTKRGVVSSSGDAVSVGRWSFRENYIDAIFFVLLAILIVRPTYGAADNDQARAALQDVLDAGGDIYRQIIYTGAFLLSVVVWVSRKGAALPRGFSIAHICLIGWIIASSLWAVDPGVALRRSVLLLFVMTFILIPIDLIGSRRTEKVLYLLLALCLIVSLVAVPLFPFARHPITETDPSIIGDWRGVFAHKNVAGGVVAIGTIVFFFKFLEKRNFIDAGLILLSLLFLAGSHSKTPAGFLPIAIIIGLLYKFLFRTGRGRIIFGYLCLTLLTLLVCVIALKIDSLNRILSNPLSFTGRAGIWAAVWAYAKDHPLLGAGYSSLFGTSVRPPIAPYVNDAYQEFMGHSHDGYLDLLGTIGLPGLFMAITSAIVIPIVQICLDRDTKFRNTNAMLLAIVVFCALENLLETQLYSKDKEIWTFFFISIIILQIRYRERHDGSRRVYRRLIGKSASQHGSTIGMGEIRA